MLVAMGAVAWSCGSSGSGASATNSSGTSTSGSTGTGGGGAGGTNLCGAAEPILQPDDTESGFVKCPDGAINRDKVVDCSPAVASPTCSGNEGAISCASDADCTDAPNGVCRHVDAMAGQGGSGPDRCDCIYPCENDTDCGADEACVCDGVVDDGQGWAKCLPDTLTVTAPPSSVGCLTNADCPSNECGLYAYDAGCEFAVWLACRTNADTCRADGQCGTGFECGPGDGGTAWTCFEPSLCQ